LHAKTTPTELSALAGRPVVEAKGVAGDDVRCTYRVVKI